MPRTIRKSINKRTAAIFAVIGLSIAACEMSNVELKHHLDATNGKSDYSIALKPTFPNPTNANEINKFTIELQRGGDLTRRVQVIRAKIKIENIPLNPKDDDWKRIEDFSPKQNVIVDRDIEANYTYYYRIMETIKGGSPTVVTDLQYQVDPDMIISGDMKFGVNHFQLQRLLFEPNARMLFSNEGLSFQVQEIIGAPNAQIVFHESKGVVVRSLIINATKATGQLTVDFENPALRQGPFPDVSTLMRKADDFESMPVSIQIQKTQDFKLELKANFNLGSPELNKVKRILTPYARVEAGHEHYVFCHGEKIPFHKLDGVFKRVSGKGVPEYIMIYLRIGEVGLKEIALGSAEPTEAGVIREFSRMFGGATFKDGKITIPSVNNDVNNPVFSEIVYQNVETISQAIAPEFREMGRYRVALGRLSDELANRGYQAAGYERLDTNGPGVVLNLKNNLPQRRLIETVELLSHNADVVAAYFEKYKIHNLGVLPGEEVSEMPFESQWGERNLYLIDTEREATEILEAFRKAELPPERFQKEVLYNGK